VAFVVAVLDDLHVERRRAVGVETKLRLMRACPDAVVLTPSRAFVSGRPGEDDAVTNCPASISGPRP
jgi:hypothetical protein